MPKTLKIAISGFPGTGKTSLATALGKRLGIPIINENMVDIVNAHVQYLASPKLDGQLSESLNGENVRRLIDAFIAWDKERTDSYAKNTSFVADRWEVDLLYFWLVTFETNNVPVDAITSLLLKNFQEKSKIFDLIVVTPLIPPFTQAPNESGIGRRMNLTSHILNMSITLSLMQNFASVPIFSLPNEPISVAERVDLVVSRLGLGSATKP